MRPDAEPSSVRWRMSERSADGGQFRWGVSDRGFVAEWVGVLVAQVDEAGNVLSLDPTPGANEHAVEKLARGGGRAFAGWIAGRPSLHAAAVRTGRDAIALVGPSGAGKSTLAAALCERAGVELLADDILLLERAPVGGSTYFAIPTETSCSQKIGTSGAKRRIAVRNVATETAPLRAIVDLRFEPDLVAPTLRRLHGAEAFSRVASALLRFEATADRLRRDMDNAAEVAQSVEVWELARPRQLDALSQCIERVLNRGRAVSP